LSRRGCAGSAARAGIGCTGSALAAEATAAATAANAAAGEECALAALDDGEVVEDGGDLGRERGEFIIAGAEGGLDLGHLIGAHLGGVSAETAVATTETAAAAGSAAPKPTAAARSTTAETATAAGSAATAAKSTTTATAAESAAAATLAAATESAAAALCPGRAGEKGHDHDRREGGDCFATQHKDLLKRILRE